MGDKAKITARPFLNGKEMTRKDWPLKGGLPLTCEVECSTDLPQDAIGEVVTLCAHRAWKCGIDPKNDKLTIQVSFS